MFGKILVFLHLALSLCFATWAMVLYTNRVNWTNKPAQGIPAEGELTPRMAEYDRLTKSGIRPVDTRWREARAQLGNNETSRPRERPWYNQQLDFLQDGAAENSPVRQIDRGPDGNPIVVVNPAPGGDLLQMGPLKDPAGQPFNNRDGQPLALKSMVWYDKEYSSTIAQIVAAIKRLQDASERDTVATNKLKGPKGLHAKLEFEKVKQERVLDEYNEVRPLWLNTAVELKNLEDLRLRLEVRLKELQAVASKLEKEGR
jgi:hypothetical protein